METQSQQSVRELRGLQTSLGCSANGHRLPLQPYLRFFQRKIDRSHSFLLNLSGKPFVRKEKCSWNLSAQSDVWLLTYKDRNSFSSLQGFVVLFLFTSLLNWAKTKHLQKQVPSCLSPAALRASVCLASCLQPAHLASLRLLHVSNREKTNSRRHPMDDWN